MIPLRELKEETGAEPENKHIAIKLNYSYFLPGANVKVIDKNDFSVLQGRFQFIF